MTHDLFFKRLIETLFEQLFEELLLKVYQRIDVTTITPMKDSFIQKELEQFYSDLLFRVLLDGNEGYLYFLFEHKSYSDPQIAFQMLQYMLAIWMQELEERAEGNLPVILPIVFYHGKEQWQDKSAIIDWIGGEKIDHLLRTFIPQFEFLFYDFSTDGNEPLLGSVKLKAYLQLIKSLYSEDIEQLYSIVVQLEQAEEMNYF